MITLYWCPKTRASRALWLLEELGEPFDVVKIDLKDRDAPRPDEFEAISPMGKVPAVSVDGQGLAESAAIALYLADRFPGRGLAPPVDDPDRPQYLYWTLFTPAVIEPAMAEKFNGWEVSRGTSGWGNFDAMIETLTAGLQAGPWLLGERFSAADTLVGSSVYFMRLFGILPDSSVLNDYADRCLARPAYQAALQRETDG